MKLSLHALKSRVARKAVVYFLISSLVPLGFLSAITYFKLSSELQQTTREYVHQETKSIGMNIYNELRLIRNELERHANIIKSQGLVDIIQPTISDRSSVNFFFTINNDGLVRSFDNKLKPKHANMLFNYLYQNKILGKPLLMHFPAQQPGQLATLYLIVPIDETSEQSGFIGAEMNTLNVLGIEVLQNRSDLICIISEIGTPIYCNQDYEKDWLISVLTEQEKKNSNYYTWNKNDSTSYTSYWSIFLDSQFQVDRWIVAIARPVDESQVVLDSIRQTLLFVALFTILAVIALTLPIIRSRVLPLEKILSATKSLAGGNFQTRVDIHSRDEFQEIGDAFNRMTDKLSQSFDYQNVLSQIGAQLLNSDSAKSIFQNIHRELIKLDEVNAAGLIYFDLAKYSEQGFYYAISDSPIINNKALTYRDSSQLPDHVWFGTGQELLDSYPFLEVLGPERRAQYTVLPIYIEVSLIAVLLVDVKEHDESLSILFEQISDSAAIALNKIILTREIKFQANHDNLTNLPNRLLLNDRLSHAILKAEREYSLFAVLFFDLDRFKEINDSLGHTIGDELLKIVAHRLSTNLRKGDTLARLGGDEFIVLAETLENPEGAAVLAEKLKLIVEQPYYCNGHELFITASIGISVYPKDGEDNNTLIRNADAAMYLAKEHSNSYEFYSTELTERALDRIEMEKDIRNALIRSEFTLAFQPQYSLLNDELCGIEALIRWQHPTKGFISPYHFIPVAEETGLINQIGFWVLETACRQISEWKREVDYQGRVAVNLSVKQLRHPDLIGTIKRSLTNTGCKPEWIELEVTEGYLMHDPENAITQLEQLQSMGISLAIDDFGTGYSSLSYLKKLPISKLKIDKSFVDELPHDEDDVAIAKTIISLAKSMGLKVIAEGVETEEQRQFLKENLCDEVQGYLLSKPVSAEEIKFTSC